MTQITEAVPAVGDPNSTFDPATAALITSFQSKFNGAIDADNLNATEARRQGLTKTVNGARTGRATAVVATAETTASATYTDVATVGPAVTLTDVQPGSFVLLIYTVDIRRTVNVGPAQADIFVKVGSGSYAAILNPRRGPDATDFAIATTTSASFVTKEGMIMAIPILNGATTDSVSFKMVYKCVAGQTEVQNRRLAVVALQ